MTFDTPDDETQLYVALELPPGRAVTVAEVHPHVYGHFLEDGAKPWPFYRDAESGAWWSLSTPSEVVLDRVVWAIDLLQLHRKPEAARRAFLLDVLGRLGSAARAAGGRAVCEGSLDDALARVEPIGRRAALERYEAVVVVAAPRGGAFSVDAWWRALEAEGFVWGDGDLFWAPDPGDPERYDAIGVEPHTVPGYFHPGDRGGTARFADVRIHFRARAVVDAGATLDHVVGKAEALARRLGGRVLSADGGPFDRDAAHGEMARVVRELAR